MTNKNEKGDFIDKILSEFSPEEELLETKLKDL